MTAIEVMEIATVDTIIATIVETETVEIGIAGPQGPPGTAGSAPQAYTHVQGVAASTWTVNHNLGFYPNVTVIDSSNRVVIGDIAYPSANQMVLGFSAAFSGVAYLS